MIMRAYIDADRDALSRYSISDVHVGIRHSGEVVCHGIRK